MLNLWIVLYLTSIANICLAIPALNTEFEWGAHMGCHSGQIVRGPPNLHDINEGNPVLLNTTANGALYLQTVPNLGGNTTATFYVVHVYGDAYTQGYAQGELLKSQIVEFMDKTYVYLEAQIAKGLLNYVPPWLAILIADLGFDAALDLVYEESKKYTNPDFYEEIQGLADSTGLEFMKIVRIHMLPGLTKGACSMFGAWGNAVPQTSTNNGTLLQLRALDWDMSGPFRDYSSITVYHPDPANITQGHPWINIGFIGFVGALTGVSSEQLGISEIGVSFPDSTFGPNNGSESLVPIPGQPFIVLLRDILKFDTTVDDSINRMINQKRTCNLILGVGDGKFGYFRGMEYSPHTLNVYDPKNQQPLAKWHPRLDDTVYWGMDWNCSTFNQLLAEQLVLNMGNITPEIAIRNITAVEQSGDNQCMYYELTKMQLYLSFAAPTTAGGPPAAYARQFTHFDAMSLMNLKNPHESMLEPKLNMQE